MEICVFCKYWDESGRHKPDGFGECRRFPRRAVVEDGGRVYVLPITKEDDWCGGFVDSADSEKPASTKKFYTPLGDEVVVGPPPLFDETQPTEVQPFDQLEQLADIVAKKVAKEVFNQLSDQLASQKTLLSRVEYAKQNGISAKTVDRAIADGRLIVKRIGSRVLIPATATIKGSKD